MIESRTQKGSIVSLGMIAALHTRTASGIFQRTHHVFQNHFTVADE